jgi:DNA-binding transcriptional ArsR family regulator
MPKTNTKQRILDYVAQFGEVSPHQLVTYLGISPQALFRHLKALMESNQLTKLGAPPKVYYRMAAQRMTEPEIAISEADRHQLSQFYYVSPIGDSYEGLAAMVAWCERQGLPIQKTIEEYKTTVAKYDQYKSEDRINGIQKMNDTFKVVYLDAMIYFDFYAIERFGKTKLGYLLLYSKQGQSVAFMKQLIHAIKPKIQSLVQTGGFDAIAFVPPTVKREIQVMKLIEKECSFGLRVIVIEKIKTPIVVPQKTLNKLPDRIQNARNTLLVTEKHAFKSVLLIDDAVGSGATLNEVAKQLKDKGVAKHVVGLALTGSFKGFDVLNEV